MSSNSRSPERIRHHYEVERELAARLRASSKEERTELFKTLYTELFERVPDHPRLKRRDTEEDSRRNIESQLRLIRPYVDSDTTLLEMAPGDCRLSYAACDTCRKVIGIDISDQRAPNDPILPNFELIVYNGYDVDLPDESVDVAFSYQFLEHLHPDDVSSHFSTIFRLLKPGGVYVFDTPHRFSGPHDVSRYFGLTLDCFHFQEWTYREMLALTMSHGFSSGKVIRKGKELRYPLVGACHQLVEFLVGKLPKVMRRKLALRFFQSVTLAVRKPLRV
ncbi:class I SAM-dependent methyltransferase [bacterium]|nr:class I SAM-dependent methyltransferase [Verrucomicrobiales bacterium]MDC0312122.1 class I SAM-dependent methyltransferase [bacterium]